MSTVRIFLSSPGDALIERKRARRVIERLNAAHGRFVRFEPIMWEDRFYSSHAGFQEQIARSIDCEIVVGVLRWKLGTPLHPDFAQTLPQAERALPGEAFESGTAYEIVSAIGARKAGQTLPDIYVFRAEGSPNPPLDAKDRPEIEAQWARLKAFAEKVFVTPEGHFKGAYQTYSSPDHFESQLEALLRQWLEAHVLHGRALVWPREIKGSPFRGLLSFGARHEDVFFGRAGDAARAIDRLKDAAETGFPFLLIVGPSGAGKSSFARAGIIPALTRPGAVADAAVFRVAAMRPPTIRKARSPLWPGDCSRRPRPRPTRGARSLCRNSRAAIIRRRRRWPRCSSCSRAAPSPARRSGTPPAAPPWRRCCGRWPRWQEPSRRRWRQISRRRRGCCCSSISSTRSSPPASTWRSAPASPGC